MQSAIYHAILLSNDWLYHITITNTTFLEGQAILMAYWRNRNGDDFATRPCSQNWAIELKKMGCAEPVRTAMRMCLDVS